MLVVPPPPTSGRNIDINTYLANILCLNWIFLDKIDVFVLKLDFITVSSSSYYNFLQKYRRFLPKYNVGTLCHYTSPNAPPRQLFAEFPYVVVAGVNSKRRTAAPSFF